MFGESCYVLKDSSALYLSFCNKMYMLNNFLWGHITPKKAMTGPCSHCFVSLLWFPVTQFPFTAGIPEVAFPWAFKSIALCDLYINCTKMFCWNCNGKNLFFPGYLVHAVPTAANRRGKQRRWGACVFLLYPSVALVWPAAEFYPLAFSHPYQLLGLLFPPSVLCLDNLPSHIKYLLYLYNWIFMVLSS